MRSASGECDSPTMDERRLFDLGCLVLLYLPFFNMSKNMLATQDMIQ